MMASKDGNCFHLIIGRRLPVKVLIIDDEPHVITVARLLVDWSSRGFDTILSCGSAEEALILIEENHPEMILSDINLPGLSGLDLIERVRSQGLNSQIILITAYSDFSYAQRAIKLDCVDYLLKPLSEESLNQAVDKGLRLYAEAQRAERVEEAVRGNTSEVSIYQSTADICRGVHTYIRNHYTEDITLDGLSQLFGISSSHLSRSYKKELDIGLIDDLTQVRLAAACDLLRNGKNTMEVADLTGFTDSKYFNRVFKRKFSCTPGEYRKKVRHEEK